MRIRGSSIRRSVAGLAVAGLMPLATLSAPVMVLCVGQAAMAQSAEPPTITEDGTIKGTMEITFNTRTNLDTSGSFKDGSAALGAKDIYKINITVANAAQFDGEISRLPNIYSKLIQSKKQEASLFYSVNLSLLNPRDPKQKKTVGKLVGTVPIDPKSGAFELAGGQILEQPSPMRISVDAAGRAAAFTEQFRGRLIGKAEKKEGLGSYTFNRAVGGKTVAVTVKKSDPMRFENIVLAKGPSENYPTTTVTGRLDYDYETGNWLTDGIRFRYTLDGKEYEDIVTGTIKWVEDPDRATNGKGQYEFNLRWNEEKNKTASTEGAAFEAMSDEEAFFAVDNSIPCMTGRISYVDTYSSGDTVASSKVEYALNANKLTKQQVMNFFKLWLLAVGPTNDE
jgi:hypothetical protein